MAVVPDFASTYGRPQNVTFTAGAVITGGQAVGLAGGDMTVQPTAANAANFIGFAGHDAAQGAAVTVLMGSGCVYDAVSSGALAAGVPVQAGAAGVVTAVATGVRMGIALKAAAGNVCRIKTEV